MTELFPETYVNAEQSEAIARGLHAIAAADGELHVREQAIITEFFAAGESHTAGLGALERRGPIEPAVLAAILASPQAKRLFVKTALLCAWADNDYSEGEARAIARYATACGIDADELAELEAQVKEYLLASLTHLKNVDAAVAVKRELGL
jgi:tellurite resistance protein